MILWANDTVNYSYQNRLRQTMSVQAPNGAAWAQGYTYDTARRLASVTSPAGVFNYQYNDGAEVGWIGDPYTGITYDLHEHAGALVQELTLPNGAYITNTVDNVARLTGTWLMNSGGTNLDSYVYTYNQANQRTNVVRTAGDYAGYTYDNMGELTSAIAHEPSGTLRTLERKYYTYDAAGNLIQRKDNASAYTSVAYGINSLNEITNSFFGTWNGVTGWQGNLPVEGSTTSPATNVTINGLNASLYGDNSFSRLFAMSVGSNGFTAIAKDVYGRSSTNLTSITVIPTNNAYAYDLNGNLLTDGTRSFAYDDENELISVWRTNVWRTDFAYDGKMRRRITKEFMWNGSSWLQTNEVHYVYDGNLVIQERNTNNLPMVTYTRGTDLSGTFQGAGGIGGLLARTDNSKLMVADPFASAFYHADGNGNVTCLLNAYQGIAAKYLYDPFGNMLAQYGQLADANAYRFSSKEWNGNSGLYYYLYRFYDPNLQRWLNRDPLGEYGSFNLYRFAQNAPCDFIDFDGLKGFSLNPYSIFCKVFFYQPTPPKPKTYCTLYSQTQTTCTYSCTIYKGDEILGGSLITRNKLPNGTCPSADSVANPPAPLPPPIPPTHTHSRR